MIALLIRRARPARRKEDGAAAVEFALVLPILLTLVFGIISFGFLFAQQLSLGNGARQGARAGVVLDRTCADIVTETRNGAQTIGMKANDVKIVVNLDVDENAAPAAVTKCNVAGGAPGDNTVQPCDGSSPGDKLFVYARYDSAVSVPLVPLKKTMKLESVGVFRCEFS